MNILLVTSTLGMGGAEHYSVRLAQALSKRGHRVVVAYSRGEFFSAETSGLVTVQFRLASKRGLGPLRILTDFRALSDLTRIIRQFQIDVVGTVLFSSAIWSWLAAAICRVSVTYTPMHVFPISAWTERFWFMSGFGRAFFCWLCDVHMIMLGSYFIRDWADRSSIARSRVHVARLGIDVDEFNYVPPVQGPDADLPRVAPILGKVSRLSPEKYVDRAIRVMPHVLRRIPDAKLLLIGDGPQRAELEELTRSLGVVDSVAFLGARTDVPTLLEQISVYLHLGYGPYLGIASLEAMAKGKPLVTLTDNPEETLMASETIWQGNSGFIAEGDYEQFADYIVQVLSDPQLYRRMSLVARKIVEHYHRFDRHAEQVETIFAQLVARRAQKVKA